MEQDELGSSVNDWWQWRRDKDKRDREQDEELAQLNTKVAVMDARQQIIRDNEAARHAKTPQIVISLISMGVSVLIFVLQLIAAQAGTP